MSPRAAVTKSELCRRLSAIQSAGLGVAEIKPDGTIVIGSPAEKVLPSNPDAGKSRGEIALEKWLNRAQS